MSNRVKDLYNLVIDQVVRETKSEIEESGEDPAVPEMLRTAWKRRLNDMNVTTEPIWTPDAPTSYADIAKQSPMGLQPLNTMSIPTDLSYYGVPTTDDKTAMPKTVGGELHSELKQELPLDPMQKSIGGVSSINPLGGGAGPVPGSAAMSPELQSQIHRAMDNHPYIPQTDGTADEELNSDLDDSEDELNSNDEDDEADQTQIMLCLYEKVHKVKTRWKYTLKDGIANVNGLDYVFNKATGESEW